MSLESHGSPGRQNTIQSIVSTTSLSNIISTNDIQCEHPSINRELDINPPVSIFKSRLIPEPMHYLVDFERQDRELNPHEHLLQLMAQGRYAF